MKLHTMSKNIVNIMITLADNEMLGRLLLHDVPNPYETMVDPNDSTKRIFVLPKPKMEELIRPDSSTAKIHPYPFDPEATTEDGSFIRVYYNQGDFDSSEAIAEAEIHIDIIVSKSLWLIDNGEESLIRAYDIAGRVVDLVGRHSIGKLVKLHFTGYQHLYVNTKFDCFRLYATYMSVEA